MQSAIILILQICTVAMVILLIQRIYRLKPHIKQNNRTTQLIEKIEYRLRLREPTINARPHNSNHTAPEDWVIVINYQRLAALQKTIASIQHHQPQAKILVVDNGSEPAVTQNILKMHHGQKIHKIIFNQHADTPQWQKSFAIGQAVNLLRQHTVRSITCMDNDVLATSAWIEHDLKLLQQEADLVLVTHISNHRENKQHPAQGKIAQSAAVYKQSFNGAFFLVTPDFFQHYGLPPIHEGKQDTGYEDWYYSRLIHTDNKRIASYGAGMVQDVPSLRCQADTAN